MNLNELKYKAADFSDRTFGVTNPISGPLHHIHEEIDEVINCLDTGTDPLDEFADCFLMLIDAFRKHYGNDVDMQKLIDASSDKLDVNEKRTWGKPDKNGVIKHIKEPIIHITPDGVKNIPVKEGKLFQFFCTNVNGTTSITNIRCEDILQAQRVKNMSVGKSGILSIDIAEINETPEPMIPEDRIKDQTKENS